MRNEGVRLKEEEGFVGAWTHYLPKIQMRGRGGQRAR